MPPPCLFGLCHCCAHLLCLCHSRSCLVSSLPCRCYSPSYRSAPRPCHVPLCLAFAMRNLASPCHCHATVLSALPPHRSLHRALALAFRFTSAPIRCCSSGCGAVQFLCRAHTFCSMPSHCRTKLFLSFAVQHASMPLPHDSIPVCGMQCPRITFRCISIAGRFASVHHRAIAPRHNARPIPSIAYFSVTSFHVNRPAPELCH